MFSGSVASQAVFGRPGRRNSGKWLTYSSVSLTHAVYSCFAHIVQLAIEDFMSEITQKAALETKQAIWDYNPCDSSSLVNGGLDVITTIRTLAVKVSTHTFLGRQRPARMSKKYDTCRPIWHLDIEWDTRTLSRRLNSSPLYPSFPLSYMYDFPWLILAHSTLLPHHHRSKHQGSARRSSKICRSSMASRCPALSLFTATFDGDPLAPCSNVHMNCAR